MRKVMLCICVSMIFSSCATSLSVRDQHKTSALGDPVILTTSNASTYSGELIGVTDTSILLLHENGLYQVSHHQLDKISVQGYTIGTPKYLQMLTLMLTDAAVGVVILGTTKEGSDQWINDTGVFFLLMVPLTAVAYVTSDPKTEFYCPLEREDIEQLKLCSRYPEGLSVDQQQRLLQSHSQDAFLPLPPITR
jgi:hypothetical protein